MSNPNFNKQEGWIVGENGLILHTKDRGKTWEKEKSGVKEKLTHISYIDGFGLLILGENGTLLKRTLNAEL